MMFAKPPLQALIHTAGFAVTGVFHLTNYCVWNPAICAKGLLGATGITAGVNCVYNIIKDTRTNRQAQKQAHGITIPITEALANATEHHLTSVAEVALDVLQIPFNAAAGAVYSKIVNKPEIQRIIDAVERVGDTAESFNNAFNPSQSNPASSSEKPKIENHVQQVATTFSNDVTEAWAQITNLAANNTPYLGNAALLASGLFLYKTYKDISHELEKDEDKRSYKKTLKHGTVAIGLVGAGAYAHNYNPNAPTPNTPTSSAQSNSSPPPQHETFDSTTVNPLPSGSSLALPSCGVALTGALGWMAYQSYSKHREELAYRGGVEEMPSEKPSGFLNYLASYVPKSLTDLPKEAIICGTAAAVTMAASSVGFYNRL